MVSCFNMCYEALIQRISTQLAVITTIETLTGAAS